MAYLEQGSWLRQWNPNVTWYQPPNSALVPVEMKILFCPSNRIDGVLSTAFMVPFAGQPLPNVAACDYLMCKGSNASLCEVSQVPPASRGAFDVNSATRFVDITDGTSNTFAMGEGAGSSPLYGVRQFYTSTTPAPLFPGQPPYIDQSWTGGPMATQALNTSLLLGGTLGVTAERGSQADPFDEPMNFPLGLATVAYSLAGCTNSGTAPGMLDTVSGFRSVHPGGCNFLFCDGGVRFVVQNVTASTYRALSTIAGGEILGDY
jgi:prepilin-type processing-associated H-X9-DG protein